MRKGVRIILSAAIFALLGLSPVCEASPALCSEDKGMAVEEFKIEGVKNGGGVNGGDRPAAGSAESGRPKGCSCAGFTPSLALLSAPLLSLRSRRKRA